MATINTPQTRTTQADGTQASTPQADTARSSSRTSSKKNTGIFNQARSFYANNSKKVIDLYEKIRPQITAKNLFLALLLTAIVSFVLHSVFNTICYVNFFFIAYRTLFSKNNPNSPETSFYRQAALLGTLSTVILDFIFPPTSLLFFLLTAPLTLFILKDLAQQFMDIPKKTAEASYTSYAKESFQHCLQSATSEWAYSFATAPYIHKTLFSALSQLSAVPVINNLTVFKLLFATTSLSYLPGALATLSLIGGMSLLFEHQKIATDYLFAHIDPIKQRFFGYTVDQVSQNPAFFSSLFKNFLSQDQERERFSSESKQTAVPNSSSSSRAGAAANGL